MNIKLKEFAKDSLIYGAGMWVSKLGSLILVPILSRIFLPSDYGIIDLLNYSYLFMFTIVNLNMDTGVQKFYFLREGEERKILLSSTMVLRFVFSSLIALTFILLSKKLSFFAFGTMEYWTEICWLAVILPITDLQFQLMTLLRLNRKSVIFSVYNLSTVIIQPILTYVCVVNLQQSLNGVFIAQFVTTIIVTVPLMIQQRNYYAKVVNFREAIGIMKYSLPGLPAILQGNVMDLLPRYFLAGFSTLTAVGLYGIADKIAKIIQMLRTSFNNAWNPFAFSNAGKEDEKYLYEQVFRIFALCLLFIITALTFFSKEILALLTPPRYHSAAMLVGGICFYYSLRALTLIFSTGLYSVNKVAHTSLLMTVLLGVFIISAVVLVPYYNSVGIVLSLDIAAIVWFTIYGYTVKKYFKFNFSCYRLVLVLTLAISGGVYTYYISWVSKNITSLSIFLQKILLLSLFYLISYLIVFEKSERSKIENRIKSLFVSIQ